MNRPVIGITMGDAAGVGPEIIVKALADPAVHGLMRPVVYGDAVQIARAARIVGSGAEVAAVADPGGAEPSPSRICVVDLKNLPADLPHGRVSAACGRAAYEFIAAAVEAAGAGRIHAICTAPLNKEALHLGGCPHPGHTEILASLTGTKDYAMMLVGERLRVIHVSTHVSLRQACDLVKKERVLRVIRLADEAMRLMGFERPRVAVAGLNPHCGEAGMFGREDIEETAPAVREAQALGIDCTGPVPPDTVFHRAANRGEFDVVVVMYHDQGHIPLKVLGFSTGVNVTVGLPCIRTSVDHGTAFDIAGTGRAGAESMTVSLVLAARMARTRFANLLS